VLKIFISNLSGKQIKDRQTFLLSFLDLPSAGRKISQLSGGQQRRVSLAVALLHSPQVSLTISYYILLKYAPLFAMEMLSHYNTILDNHDIGLTVLLFHLKM